MKSALMKYCLSAHAAAFSSELYSCAVGYELGFEDDWSYRRTVELGKDRKKVVFPEQIGLLPVAIFGLGVTWRLVTGVFRAVLLRTARAVVARSGGRIQLRSLPKEHAALNKDSHLS